MAAAAQRIRPLGAPGDLGWVVMAHGEVYADEFGWDGSFEALVAQIVADFAADHDPAREAGWIAELDGERVGCVFCCAKDDTTAQLRILLVHPDGRGLGLGARLVDECIRFARDVGYERMVLWTKTRWSPRVRCTWPPASRSRTIRSITASVTTSSGKRTSSTSPAGSPRPFSRRWPPGGARGRGA